MKNEVLVMPLPDNVAAFDRLTVEVRPGEDGEWVRVPLYTVHVDAHDVRTAAATIFDFAGKVQVRVTPDVLWVHSVVIRPISLGIQAENTGREIRFSLDKPTDLMLEINGERFHCLHLFAGAIQTPPAEDTIWLHATRIGPNTTPTRHLLSQLAGKPDGACLAFGPGLHMLEEYIFRVPSGLHIYLAPGAVVIGAFIIENAENVVIDGHGVILQQSFHRFSGINGIRVSHSRNITIEGITFINPAHYTVYLGGSEDIRIRGIRSFSCEGWGDGIDMMSCRRVHVDGCFLRTSDDCIAIYGRRWAYNGDAQDILVENCTLWADVAHPTIIGTHGDYEHGGNVLERITFRNIDILEHHEYQPGYLGCLAINVGDKNIARDILYEDIRVENIAHGKLLDVQVKFNPDYNPAPGSGIERVTFRNIQCHCVPPVQSVLAGYDQERQVRDVRIDNVTVCGEAIEVEVGGYVDGVARNE